MGWYTVVKTIKGHRYEYLQRTWREGRHVRTESRYIGPAAPEEGGRTPERAVTTASDFDGAFSRGDVVKATNKITGEIRERIYASQTPTGFGLADKVSGIPYHYQSSDWSLELIEKGPPLFPLKYKVGDTFVDMHDGELMTVTKVLADVGKYVLEGTSGADARGTEADLLKHFKPYSSSRTSTKSNDSRPPRGSDFDGVITTPHTFYHGSHGELAGELVPSEEGTFGPGFYLTSYARATLYARYDARIAAGIGEGEQDRAGEPQYDGRVYAFDVSGLRLKVLKHERYQRMCMALDPVGAPTPAAKAELQKLLAAEGYDGLYVLSEQRHEMVVFPGSLH